MLDWQQSVSQARHQVARRVQSWTGWTTHGSYETPNNEAYDNSGCDWSLLTPVKAEDGERTEYEDKGTYELVNEVVCLVASSVVAKVAKISPAFSVLS